jgi:hypothetical protein
MEPLWALRVLVWCAAATVALFAAAVNRRRGGRAAAMLLWGGVLTSVLAIDEAGRLHEDVLPSLFGFSEQAICSVYAAMAVAWIVRFRKEIAPPTSAWLLGGIACFAMAIAVEHVVIGRHGSLDGVLKLAGVACWAGFFIRTASRQLRAARVTGELLSLSQQEQLAAANELDATAATMAELMAMAQEAAARRTEGRTVARSRQLSDVDVSVPTR